MEEYEKLGAFYVGKNYDLMEKYMADKPFLYDSKDLVTHDVCVGMTGIGKTGQSNRSQGMTHRENKAHRRTRLSPALFAFIFLVLSASIILSQGTDGVAEDEQRVEILELSIEDKNGRSAQTSEIGGELSVISKLRNNMKAEESIAYVVQIKDSRDRVAFLTITRYALQGDNEETLRTFWRPEEEGMHVVQVFVWQDGEPPTHLSLSVAQIDIYSTEEVKCSGYASCREGIVTRIIDGDTIDVGNTTVRFALVNSPEIGESGYKEATLFTAEMCPVGSRVLVDEDDGQTSGSYGREIAKVFCGNKVINEELLESRHAVILLSYCDKSEFRSEEWARTFGC